MPGREGAAPVSIEDAASERWRRAFADLGERAAPGPECPEPDRLWAAAAGELSTPERHEIFLHTASCASCAAAFRLARGLSREGTAAPGEERTAESIRPLPSFAQRRWVRWTAPLAALAAAVLLVVLAPGGWWKPRPPYRGGEAFEIRSRLPDGAALPRDRAELRWTAGPPGARYEARVLTREGREVAVEGGLEQPRVRVPPDALAGVPAGSTLYWQVKAILPDGKTVVSKTFSVRLQ
jgi:putative zinc finger protein